MDLAAGKSKKSKDICPWHGICNFLGQQCYGGNQMQAQTQDWRTLSEAASREQDPDRLIELVQELNRALWNREMQRRAHLSSN
jgi:hypothetical protein